ncbi:MAG: hypothetical protein HC908_07595 [Calothrix sp. SM1_7_51]|nr:hypothetical protein [Calothrix sp. SM1_7_51]
MSDSSLSQKGFSLYYSVQPDSIPQPLGEATNWRVDSRGQVHLVAINQASYIPNKANVCPN